jgi:DNA-directed RNA polymerase
MMLTVNAAVERGIVNFAMIHDDFGTHAADVETFRNVIKEEFVAMYKNHDPLNDLYVTTSMVMPDGALPPPPDVGGLVLEDILDSEYFFA